MSELVIRELTPQLLDDWLGFFDCDAFADHPDWAHCYCMYFHFRGDNQAWNRCTAEVNRAAVAALITAGQMQGLLAFAAGKPVGWVNAAPRRALPKLQAGDGFAVDGAQPLAQFHVDDPERVGAIVCFVIAASARGQGVARRLLEAACDRFRAQGLAFAEAYPARQAETAADLYHGPLAMYERAGFTTYRELEKYLIVRKALTGEAAGSAT